MGTAAGSWQAARIVLQREWLLAVRRPAQVLQPLAFFAVVTAMFPLGYTPELAKLRAIAPGVLWVGALLASLLALEHLFREDASDGTLEQYVLSGQSLTWLLLAKTIAHWLLTGLPLTLMAPWLGVALGVPLTAAIGVMGALALGTWTLSLLGSIGAGLTLGVRRGGGDPARRARHRQSSGRPSSPGLPRPADSQPGDPGQNWLDQAPG